MKQLKEALGILSNDRAFMKGFRRGIGVILAWWVISQVVICVTYPLWGRILR